jgi:hypothetical protein
VQNKKASAARTAQRVIKKYPNRRLYDTDTSTYITLADVKQLVMSSEPFVVRDAKTNEDLTRSILLQDNTPMSEVLTPEAKIPKVGFVSLGCPKA